VGYSGRRSAEAVPNYGLRRELLLTSGRFEHDDADGGAAQAGQSPISSLTKAFKNGWFVACLGLLVTFCGTFQLMAYAFSLQSRKLPSPCGNR